MKAVILAGGKGRRLGSLTSETPKPMIRIGGIPLLHHQVNLLAKYGFKEIIILVNYLKSPIQEYFGDGSNFDVQISYFEEQIPLGTTGGIKEIENQLTDDFLVLYGDVMINMNLNRLIEYHTSKDSRCTLVLHPNDHPSDSDLVETDDYGRVVGFHPKPHESGKWFHNMVNAGAYILAPEILQLLSKGVKADFGREIFPAVFKTIRMYGYQTSEYLKDMGTPDRLGKVITDYESGKIKKSNYEYPQRAIFLDRDGVLNLERSFISRPDDLEVFDFTPAAIRKINDSGFLSIVVTNQSAVARNLCTEEDVRTIHKKLETELGNHNAWLDDIYYCPHHPDKGYPEENPIYKIECDCRKPAIGMFKKAIKKFNIDPFLSYMVGDSERDIQAGINAGCITAGVRTGYGIKRTNIQPDFMFTDLAQAVDFIVDDPYRSHYIEINHAYSKFHGEGPWIILIGGNTRTGKSTLASYLRINFEKEGIHVLQVSLDNWIVRENRRDHSMNVFDRFRLEMVENDLNQLFSGQPVTVSTYVNHPDRKSFDLLYDPDKTDIIIVEGIVALSSEVVRKSAHLKVFTTTDYGTFIHRIREYYNWRGKSAEDTAELIKKREQDEYQLIEKDSKLADLIINSAGT